MRFDFPTHRSGDTWRGINSITILDNDVPIDLTGCKIYIQFRSIYNFASPVVLTLTTEDNTIKVVDAVQGIITIPEQIINVPVGRYRYDLQVDFSDGSSLTYMEGEFEIKPGITSPSFDSSINTRYNALRINSLLSLISANSALWADNCSDIRALTGSWQDVTTLVKNSSASWAVDSLIRELSSNWENSYSLLNQNSSVFSIVESASSSWAVDSFVRSLSSYWQNTYLLTNELSSNWNFAYTSVLETSAKLDSVLETSPNWDSVYSNVNETSANWDSVYTSVSDTSANWDSVYTTYSENSANYATSDFVQNNFLPLSGGQIDGNLTITGDFSVLGEMTEIKTLISTTSSIDVVNTGSKVALTVTQKGSTDVAKFYDDSNLALIIKDGGNIGILTETPNVELTVNGSISSNSVIYDETGNSLEWNSVYSSVLETSANWDSVYTSVSDTSANWDSVYTSVNETSANWDSVYSSVNETSANWDSVYASVSETSANWDSVYSSVNEASANWDSVYTSVNETSANWDSVYSSVLETSANWDSVYSSVLETSANWDSVYSSVLETSANWDSVYTSVTDTSANWDSVYSSVLETSANWDSVYASVSETSANWDSVYSSVLETSANWDSVYTSVTDTSANWDSVYSSVLETSANWDSVYSSVSDTSANWDSVYTSVNETSANWDSVYSSVLETSGNWDSVYSSVSETSANWDSVYSSVSETSANWDSVYASVSETSANWDSVYTSVTDTSANWDSVYSSVLETSANWDSVYTSVTDTSANWDSVYTSVTDTSANWDSVYTTYSENSANYATSEFVQNNFLPLSGGEISGDLSVSNKFEVGSSITKTFHVENDKIGVLTQTPNVELTVNGSISSNSVIYDELGNSTEWNQAYSNVIANSSYLESVFTTVSENSSVNWSRDAEYAELKSLSGTWISTHTTVLENSALWLSEFSITQEFFDDFLTLGAASTLPNAFLKPANRGGAIFVAPENTKQGVLILSTNPLVSANQRSGVTSSSTIHFGQGTEYRLIFSARRGTNSFNDTDALGIIDMGFHNQIPTDNLDASYGCYFTSTNNSTWKAVSLNQIDYPVITDTGIPCDDTWRTFEVRIDKNATVVEYYIDDVLVATHNSGIPKNPDSQTAIGYRCLRISPKNLNVELRIDWQSLILKRNNQLWK